MNEIARTRTDWLLLAGFCAFLFFFGLNYFGLIGADEPRYAQVAREMLSRHDWITPTLQGKPWLEKPPLYYWQAMLTYAAFGVNDLAARLPSAIDATLMVIAIYWFLSRLRPGFAVDGALITASCAGVIGYARAASQDMPLAASLGIALLGWYAWYATGSKKYLALAYAFVALGTLAKGPVAPFLACAVVVIFAFAIRDMGILGRSVWTPGILLFCVIALPWYVAVQLRNPDFFRVFILQHNLERFGTNLYHHPQPFWFYLPVALLALVPWTMFVIAACVGTIRRWWMAGKSATESRDALDVFLVIWLLVPILFFSLSRSKLPGYILPAVPAGAVLLTEYIRAHSSEDDPGSPWLFVFHAIVASAPVVPALMMQYILLQHRLPWGRGTVGAVAVASVVSIGIALTLLRFGGFRLLRFVTLVPVVLTVAVVLRIGGPALDETLSARPLARELASTETRTLPIAVFSVPRETDYGLAFYRNQIVAHYERGEVPQGEHLLIAGQGAEPQIAKIVAERRVSHLGTFAAQHLDYYWVSAPGMMMGSHDHSH